MAHAQRPLPAQLQQSLFVTGTDTAVGKTWVCVQLLQALVAAGHAATGMKPVVAGTIATPEGPRNEDALALQAAGNVALPYALANPVCLHTATSPHLAAQDEARPVEIDAIMQAYASIRQRSGLIIVEGAGGWLAPISPPEQLGTQGPTMENIAVALGLPVLLVIGIRLGSLSHALLTAQAIRRSGLPLLGWVANCLDPGFADVDRYIDSLAERLPEPLLWRS